MLIFSLKLPRKQRFPALIAMINADELFRWFDGCIPGHTASPGFASKCANAYLLFTMFLFMAIFFRDYFSRFDEISLHFYTIFLTLIEPPKHRLSDRRLTYEFLMLFLRRRLSPPLIAAAWEELFSSFWSRASRKYEVRRMQPLAAMMSLYFPDTDCWLHDIPYFLLPEDWLYFIFIRLPL